MGRALNHNSWCCMSFLILAQTQIFDRTLKFQFASPLCPWNGFYAQPPYKAVTRLKAIKDCEIFTNTMLWALEVPTPTEEVWRKLVLNLKRPQLTNSFVLSNSLHRDIWPKAVAGLNIVEALVILGTAQAGGCRSPGCWKADKTKILVWQQEGLLCGENGDVLFITSGFDEETGSSWEVPESVLGGKSGKCFTSILQEWSFCSIGSPLHY